MKKFKVVLIGLLFATFASGQATDQGASSTPAAVQGVDFNYKQNQPQSRLEITLDKNATFKKTVPGKNQVAIEISNAKLDKKYSRRLDTSSFDSTLLMVSPYQVGSDVRVVLQMKDGSNVDVTQEGNKIVATIDNGKDVVPSTASTAPAAPASADAAPAAATDAAPAATVAAASPAPAPNSENLEEFMQAQQTKTYTGKKIFLEMRDADIQDVFRTISEASEFNIILSDEVKGKLTINLQDVPWDQALDIILHSNKLAAERNGNILRVTSMDALTKEKEAEAAAKRATEAAEPIIVKIFPISYAKIDELKRILDDFLSKDVISTGNSNALSNTKRGSIQVDQRTNSLVVRDTPTTIEKIKRILKELDTQTPQILIEAKFVQVQENNSSDVEGRIYTTTRELDSTSNQMTFQPTQTNYGALFGGAAFGTSGLPNSFAVTPVPGASFGFAPKAGLLPGLSEIGALISILETTSKAKVIASPRVVTQNKEPAEINQGQTIQLPTTAGANSPGSFITVNAVLRLQITPQVTNDGTINMKISFSQDSLSAQQLGSGSLSTDTKKVDTTVLVDSGATLVIGGIYSSSVNNSEAGIPFLRELPIIGALFGSKTISTVKSELLIFLTPRILNEKEAGMKGST